MVCLGNICRSPLAEGILRSKLSVEHFVDSAGTIGFHEGEKPDRRSIETAARHGIDISGQRSRPLQKADFQRFDRIYCMDKSNLRDVLSLAENAEQKAKVSLIIENTNVPDPYYGSAKDFENVFQMLDEACEEIAREI
jgi:protein-tyrosine phosphatase